MHDLWPEWEIPKRVLIGPAWQTKIAGRLRRTATTVQVQIARDMITRVRELTRTITQLYEQLAGLVTQVAPQLLAEKGLGVLIAAKLIGEIAGIDRFTSDAKLARVSECAPIPVSSGRTDRHRLDPGGNRQLNHAFHMLALTKILNDPQTAVYLAKTAPQRQDQQRSDPQPQTPPGPTRLPPTARPQQRPGDHLLDIEAIGDDQGSGRGGRHDRFAHRQRPELDSGLATQEWSAGANVGTPGADGYSPGIWAFSATANGAHHVVIADPGQDTFTSPVYVGQNEIAFAADNNIWKVPASCNACSFPSGATQLTTDGTSAAPDSDPSWTSQTVVRPGGRTPPPPPSATTFKLSASTASNQKVLKQKGLVASVKCNLSWIVVVRGGVAIKSSKKLLLAKPAGLNLTANRTYKITVKFSKSRLKTIAKALARHKKVTAEIVVEADDSAGKQLTVTKYVTVTH